MPLVSGPISPTHGAVVDLIVGVSKNRRKRLQSAGLPIPAPINVRTIIDTGSALTGFRSVVFAQLQVSHFAIIPVRTTSTQPGQPHQAKQFDVSLALFPGGAPSAFFSVRAIASDDFDPQAEDGVEGILGRDILDRFNLFYRGLDRQFDLAW